MERRHFKLSRLRETYDKEIVEAMTKKFGYKNVMEVPKLEKIVVNMGVGEAKENQKILESACKDMEEITGQNWVVRCCLLCRLVSSMVAALEVSLP